MTYIYDISRLRVNPQEYLECLTCRCMPYSPSKCHKLLALRPSVTSKKTWIFSKTAVRTSNPIQVLVSSDFYKIRFQEGKFINYTYESRKSRKLIKHTRDWHRKQIYPYQDLEADSEYPPDTCHVWHIEVQILKYSWHLCLLSNTAPSMKIYSFSGINTEI